MKFYKAFSLVLTAAFAAVGLAFLFVPAGVLKFFNNLSQPLSLPQAPVQGLNFYLILALGYMYLVTVLAWMTYRHSENKIYPLLLAHGKLASSALSFCLVIFDRPFLIYVTNGIVDGLIGIFFLFFYFKIKKGQG